MAVGAGLKSATIYALPCLHGMSTLSLRERVCAANGGTGEVKKKLSPSNLLVPGCGIVFAYDLTPAAGASGPLLLER
jgi:hypothetical protein